MASTSSYPRSPYTTLFRSTSAGADTTYKEIVAGARSNMDVIKAERVSQLVQSGKFDEVLAQASTLGDLVLTQAGVNAIQAQKAEQAAKLFEAALAQNAYQRDALNNLAATYYQLKQYDKIVPIVQR